MEFYKKCPGLNKYIVKNHSDPSQLVTKSQFLEAYCPHHANEKMKTVYRYFDKEESLF